MPTAKPMQLGMVGLGRMGANIVRRLMRDGHTCVVFDVDPEVVAELEKEGATGSGSVADFIEKLKRPRAAWVMVPAGDITAKTIEELAAHMTAGRHDYRRGQLVLPGRHPPRRQTVHKRHPPRRLRNERRGLGARSRVTAS